VLRKARVRSATKVSEVLVELEVLLKFAYSCFWPTRVIMCSAC
jgi:glycerol-3-phosphate dehydrogenase